MVTSLGLSASETWAAMLEGRSGIDFITGWGDLDEVRDRFNLPADLPLIAGEVRDFDLKKLMVERKEGFSRDDLKQVKYMDPFTQYAYAATLEAVADSGARLEKGEVDPDRVGVIIGSGMGGTRTWENEVRRFFSGKKVSPFAIPRLIPNLAAANVSISFKARGANSCLTTACASGTHAIGEAFQRIQLGREDAIACGGTEACITPFTVTSFHVIKALAAEYENPQSASRPFDADRNGFVIADGSGIVILEEWEHALARGARIYAEVIGFAMTGDANHITEPDKEGAKRCMNLALRDAEISPADIDLINPHATATPKGDASEAAAILEIFGSGGDRPLITANKSQLGHALGGIGGIEAVSSVLSIYNQRVPPILNLDNIDPGCSGLSFVRDHSKPARIDTVLSNSFGFGGTNATLIFRKFADQ